ncbi:ABC transporter ATP-binding protein [Chlamydia sp.]|uniref:ABC transporter ATP-binding protein n=1 Tax=Chlamydia sp. TaxID=35827 RepID=UPI0025C544D9|nr:ABC transporter ATP-binding protein [Chlamydia sp.]MBQ8498200.1 ABC transporter ATP-binding protein [Chlamydia sp.]
MGVLVEARHVSKTVKQRDVCVDILKDVCFQLYAGEVVAITGASGSGKSTLLHLLGTLDQPSSGQVLFFGKSVRHEDLPIFRNRRIGFIFQNFYLLEDDSVINNVLTPAQIARKDTSKKSEAYERAFFLLETVGLADRRSEKSGLLSGGEKQRVAIARALMNDPEIVLADEPSGNLDRRTANTIHELLLSLAEHHRGVLIVTHDKELAEKCHREEILRDGTLTSADA